MKTPDKGGVGAYSASLGCFSIFTRRPATAKGYIMRWEVKGAWRERVCLLVFLFPPHLGSWDLIDPLLEAHLCKQVISFCKRHFLLPFPSFKSVFSNSSLNLFSHLFRLNRRSRTFRSNEFSAPFSPVRNTFLCVIFFAAKISNTCFILLKKKPQLQLDMNLLKIESNEFVNSRLLSFRQLWLAGVHLVISALL